MNSTALIVLLVVAAVAASPRTKRQAYELPDGAELLLGPIRTTFQCQANGYFADVDNNCNIFHVCNEIARDDGTSEFQHYSFLCGNQTIFNQLSLTCTFPEEAVPCQNAPDFFYVNDNIGRENVPFLTDDDLQRAEPLIPGFSREAAASAQQEYRAPAQGGYRAAAATNQQQQQQYRSYQSQNNRGY